MSGRRTFVAELLFFCQYRGLIYDSYGYYVLSQRLDTPRKIEH